MNPETPTPHSVDGTRRVSATSQFLNRLSPTPDEADTTTAAAGPGAGSLPVVSAVRSRIESVLLVIDSPAPADLIARAVECTVAEATEILTQIREEYLGRESGVELRETTDGWRLYTASRNAPAVERLLLDGTQSRLTRAALETLAVVAYRQPCTRSQVAGVRGVNVDGVMRTLLLRGLVKEVGQEQATGAHLYATTELFLELLGIDDISVLPDLAPLLPDIDTIDESY
ncbi:SMC-Scp complex subunit ScpB [Corynebacterium mendelii]|uniref:SMC-Scp complex subunit ScpB n=1 Tax=Corynebacterium mendelii TaxID=2765362 RepID=A0A939DZA3_9CORY|nr:SMC-Scp complex subunit ScpB [Corynebacterium mendelii]MBN9643574.1 SMC-Scp complex subunit ScpB [Corynebacterium mendelii]